MMEKERKKRKQSDKESETEKEREADDAINAAGFQRESPFFCCTVSWHADPLGTLHYCP